MAIKDHYESTDSYFSFDVSPVLEKKSWKICNSCGQASFFQLKIFVKPFTQRKYEDYQRNIALKIHFQRGIPCVRK